MDIRADIIDITGDTPRKDDTFLVDTNILFWWFYPDQLTKSDVVQQYDKYFERIVESGAQISYCQASLIELAHVIEMTKLATYNNINRTNHSLKHYRQEFSGERDDVVETIKACWDGVKNNATPIDVVYDDRSLQQALVGLTAYQVDAYDYIQIDAMQTHGITQILTDDGDYATVAGIEVFTANWKAINLARSAGKLIQRP